VGRAILPPAAFQAAPHRQLLAVTYNVTRDENGEVKKPYEPNSLLYFQQNLKTKAKFSSMSYINLQ
jgi:hypothetical protein